MLTSFESIAEAVRKRSWCEAEVDWMRRRQQYILIYLQKRRGKYEPGALIQSEQISMNVVGQINHRYSVALELRKN